MPTTFFKGEVPDATLTAVCDVAPERLEAAKKAFGDQVKTFRDGRRPFAAGVVDAGADRDAALLPSAARDPGVPARVPRPQREAGGRSPRSPRDERGRRAQWQSVWPDVQLSARWPDTRRCASWCSPANWARSGAPHYVITDWFRTQAYYNSGGWRATWSGEGGGVLANQCPHNLDLWQWIWHARACAPLLFGKVPRYRSRG